jgi:hypothetical protein
MRQHVNRRDFVKSVASASIAPFLLSGTAAPLLGAPGQLRPDHLRRDQPLEPLLGKNTLEAIYTIMLTLPDEYKQLTLRRIPTTLRAVDWVTFGPAEEK